MNFKPVVSAIMTMCLTTGGAAFAQGNSDHNDRGRGEQGQNRAEQAHRDNDARGDNRNQARDRDVRSEHYEGRGAGPNHNYYRGGRLPAEYRHRQYVVDDWRGHNLSAPPRGYHWVQTGSDYVLIAIATGIIAELLLNR